MSFGSLHLGNKEYKSLSDSGEKIHANDFTNAQYFPDTTHLAGSYGIPESAISELNIIIGNFLIAILEASYVDRDVLNVVPVIPHPARGEGHVREAYDVLPLARASTLSANGIASVIHEKIEEVIREILTLIPGSQGMNREDKDHVFYRRNETLTFSKTLNHEEEICHANFITGETRNAIEQLGAGYADMVNNILKGLATNILHRADLTFASLRRDVTKLHGPLSHSERMAHYSTLNPVDLIKMAKENLKDIPMGLAMGYSEADWAKMFEHLRDRSGTI